MKLIVLLCSFFGSLFTYSQSYHGYYGKKNFVDLISVNHSPIVYNIFGSANKVGYKNEDGSIAQSRRTWFNSGFHISAGRALRNNLSIGIEYGADFKKVFAPYVYYGQQGDNFWGNPYNPDGIAHEDITMVRHVFLPKVEFSHRDALLPMGLSYTVGFGVTMSKIQQKDYLVGFIYEDYDGETEFEDLPEDVELTSADLIDYSEKYFGLQIMGAIKMRTPLTSFLFINYGVRYMLNIKLYDTHGYSTEFSTRGIVARSGRTNFISLDLGLSVPF